MKKISIIIPHYKEKENIIDFNLKMISLQQDIDFNDIEVVIVNDGPESYKFPSKYLKSFSPLYIRQLNLEKNVGPGLARQYGIDNTNSDYIMFIDVDDGFSSVISLYNYLKVMRDHPDADLIEADFIYETLESIDSMNLKVERNTMSKNTWLHSKLFKREFLKKYDIHFLEDVRLSEDVAFCTMMTVKDIKRYFIPYDCYFYKTYNNKSSLTKKYSQDKIRLSHIDASIKSFDFCKKHKENYEELDKKLFKTLTYCYFLLYSDWDNENNKKEFTNMLLHMFVDNFNIYNQLTEEEKAYSYLDQLKDYLRVPYLITTDKIEELEKTQYSDLEEYFKDILKKSI